MIEDEKLNHHGHSGKPKDNPILSGLLNLKLQIDGTWSYEEGTQILTMDTTAYGFGQSQHETISIRTTGREN